MAEKSVKVPEFLRESIDAAQARFEVLEGESRKVLGEVVARGKEGRKELEHLVQKLSKQDWTVEDLKARIGRLSAHGRKLGVQGLHAAALWRGRATHEALARLAELQARAISFLGVASREQVEDLSRELARLSKRLEKGRRPRRARRAAELTEA